MKNKYHIVYITEFPTFYKSRLFNELEKKCNNLVVYINNEAVHKSRNDDFFKGEKQFDNVIISGNYYSRFLGLRKILDNIDYDEVVFSGWDNLLYWLIAFLYPQKYNSIIVESSYFESSTKGFGGLAKRLFLKRINKVYASGQSQKHLVEKLGFDRKIIKTKGVGVFNYLPQFKYVERRNVENFIYVGRLVEVKNLKFLIKVFNSLPQLKLHIIGFGEQESELKVLANDNIKFYGAIGNTELPQIYQQMDVFILPSKSETWGLVVEEALNNGLPVILSDRVGCAEEIIDETKGFIFKCNNEDELKNIIHKVTNDISFYNSLRKSISKMNFEEVEHFQVNCYL